MGYLDDKVAVITGAGSGMAKAAVKIFVREGARGVVAGDISGAEKDTAAEVGANVLPVHCDVTQEADIEAMMRAAKEEFGRIDAVLNVAGTCDPELIEDATQENYDKTMNIHLRGVFFGTKHAIRAMKDQGSGAIVNWAAVGGLGGFPYVGIYGAAKHGIIGTTKTAAIEAGPYNIRVNAVCPGATRTEIMGAGIEQQQDLVEKSVFKRVGEPHEVSEIAAFLCSDRAAWVTGAVIPCDGGWSCRVA
jgi:NAD(P)-dependent dehydrogenase (short-subunit alcohol dehydrogenase family)